MHPAEVKVLLHKRTVKHYTPIDKWSIDRAGSLRVLMHYDGLDEDEAEAEYDHFNFGEGSEDEDDSDN